MSHNLNLGALDLAGKILAREKYTIGGYSDISKGILQKDSEAEVAIKHLRIRGISNTDASRERLWKHFYREILLWRKLIHPNVVPLLGYMISDECPALISPWYVNGNLNDYLAAHDPPDRWSLALDVGNGLEYLHSISIVHGDLKGENVLVDGDGCASLCDFGMSQFVDKASGIPGFTTTNAYNGGTERFMSPEVCNSAPKTAATDMWAFGCLIIQILTDEIPYKAFIARTAVLLAIVSGKPPSDERNTKIPMILWNWIQTCWSLKQDDRPKVSEFKSLALANLEQLLSSSGSDTISLPADSSCSDATNPGQLAIESSCTDTTPLPSTPSTPLSLSSPSPPIYPKEVPKNSTTTSNSDIDFVSSSTSYRVLIEHSDGIAAVAISREGKRIASCAGGVVRIWDTQSSTLVREIAQSQESIYTADMAWDGSRVVTAGRNRNILLWNAQSGQLILKIKGHAYRILSVALSKDGTKLVSCSEESVWVWHANTGDALCVLEDTKSSPFLQRNAPRSVAFSPDSVHVAIGGTDRFVRIWNVTNGNREALMKGHLDDIASLVFSADGRRLYSGSRDNTVRVWDWTKETCILTFYGFYAAMAIAVSNDGKFVVCSSGNDILVWRADTGGVVQILKGHTRDITCIAFLPDGTGVVSGSEDKTLRIWNVNINPINSRNIQGQQVVDDINFTPDPPLNSPIQDNVDVSEPASLSSSQAASPLADSDSTPSESYDGTTESNPPQINHDGQDNLFGAGSSAAKIIGLTQTQRPSISRSASNSTISPIHEEVETKNQGTPTMTSEFTPCSKTFSGKYQMRSTQPQAYGAYSRLWTCGALLNDNTVRKVAMKELRAVHILREKMNPEYVSATITKRLQEEVLVWSGLEHPHIVPLIGFRMEPTTCLFSPWYSNGNVKDWVKNRPEVNKRKLMRQVANGLVYLHSRNPPIIHGNVKSTNVLIDDEGNAVIKDFGLSQILGDEIPDSDLIAVIENARWQAPEIYIDGANRSKPGDVYAFGCLLLEIATGALPFRWLGNMQVAGALMISTQPAVDRATYPELPKDDPLWDLMSYCWRYEPEDRPTMIWIEARFWD